MAGMVALAGSRSWYTYIQALLLVILSIPALSSAYRPGDIIRMSKMGQYHSSRTTWHDVIGKHCPIFAVNRERYSGGDLLGVTAQVIDMPLSYLNTHQEIRKQFWDPEHWPKHVLVRYKWKEQSEIDVSSGFYVLFGSALTFSFVLSIYVLQSSKEKLTRFVRETVVESSSNAGGLGIGKVE